MFRSPKSIAWLDKMGYDARLLETIAQREGDTLLIDPMHPAWLSERDRVKAQREKMREQKAAAVAYQREMQRDPVETERRRAKSGGCCGGEGKR